MAISLDIGEKSFSYKLLGYSGLGVVMRVFLLAWALLIAAPDVAAASQKPAAADLESVSDDMSAFGQWLTRLGAIQQPLQAELAGLGERWRAAFGPDPVRGAREFRPYIDAVLASLDRVHAEIEAFDTPVIALDLPAEVLPPAIKANTLQINRELRAAIEGFIPLLEVLGRRDVEAANAAVSRLLESMRLVIDSRALMSRAYLAIIPQTESAWDAQNVDYLFFRAGSRVLRAWPNAARVAVDPTLAVDLRELAGALETSVRNGRRKSEAEEAEVTAAIQRQGDTAMLDIARRTRAVLREERAVFTVAEQLAALIREHAEGFDGRPLTPQGVSAFIGRFQQVRASLDQIHLRSSAALAGQL